MRTKRPKQFKDEKPKPTQKILVWDGRWQGWLGFEFPIHYDAYSWWMPQPPPPPEQL